ncbi:NOD26-like intrinsic protein 1;2 [Actinidia rufa]|uniref:NOD26-like intrinsic protein 12 n=1 Tax=Actinidia rufa TaxID=165716 RepID=A0A7J0DDF1_9ERIC|nr:NOD26-like intrinsic protein 1;2 [Actinidia rufa]
MEEGHCGESSRIADQNSGFCASNEVVLITQKVIAEAIGTYFLIFAGCGSVAVNKIYGSITFPGICVMVGSILASGTLYLLFDVNSEAFFGTIPVGSDVQSLIIEFITSFLLMFVISGVATDNRSVTT